MADEIVQTSEQRPSKKRKLVTFQEQDDQASLKTSTTVKTDGVIKSIMRNTKQTTKSSQSAPKEFDISESSNSEEAQLTLSDCQLAFENLSKSLMIDNVRAILKIKSHFFNFLKSQESQIKKVLKTISISKESFQDEETLFMKMQNHLEGFKKSLFEKGSPFLNTDKNDATTGGLEYQSFLTRYHITQFEQSYTKFMSKYNHPTSGSSANDEYLLNIFHFIEGYQNLLFKYSWPQIGWSDYCKQLGKSFSNDSNVQLTTLQNTLTIVYNNSKKDSLDCSTFRDNYSKCQSTKRLHDLTTQFLQHSNENLNHLELFVDFQIYKYLPLVDSLIESHGASLLHKRSAEIVIAVYELSQDFQNTKTRFQEFTSIAVKLLDQFQFFCSDWFFLSILKQDATSQNIVNQLRKLEKIDISREEDSLMFKQLSQFYQLIVQIVTQYAPSLEKYTKSEEYSGKNTGVWEEILGLYSIRNLTGSELFLDKIIASFKTLASRPAPRFDIIQTLSRIFEDGYSLTDRRPNSNIHSDTNHSLTNIQNLLTQMVQNFYDWRPCRDFLDSFVQIHPLFAVSKNLFTQMILRKVAPFCYYTTISTSISSNSFVRNQHQSQHKLMDLMGKREELKQRPNIQQMIVHETNCVDILLEFDDNMTKPKRAFFGFGYPSLDLMFSLAILRSDDICMIEFSHWGGDLGVYFEMPATALWDFEQEPKKKMLDIVNYAKTTTVKNMSESALLSLYILQEQYCPQPTWLPSGKMFVFVEEFETPSGNIIVRPYSSPPNDSAKSSVTTPDTSKKSSRTTTNDQHFLNIVQVGFESHHVEYMAHYSKFLEATIRSLLLLSTTLSANNNPSQKPEVYLYPYLQQLDDLARDIVQKLSTTLSLGCITKEVVDQWTFLAQHIHSSVFIAHDPQLLYHFRNDATSIYSFDSAREDNLSQQQTIVPRKQYKQKMDLVGCTDPKEAEKTVADFLRQNDFKRIRIFIFKSSPVDGTINIKGFVEYVCEV